MLALEFSVETNDRLNETVNCVNSKLNILANLISIGERLVKAFGTNDKAKIAEKLGFSSVQAVYKVLSGERELDFEKLLRFRDSTNCSIDWLLTGLGEMRPGDNKTFDLEYSIDHSDDWRDVIEDWYKFEGQTMPEFEGASFMGGWEMFTKEQKINAIKDLKSLLDRAIDQHGRA